MKNSMEHKKADPFLLSIGIHEDRWRLDYDKILKELSFMKANKPDLFKETIKMVAEQDFFFFCYVILDLPVNHPFLMARCYEVQDDINNNMLYLWSRDHWKSTLITFASTLWVLINNPTYTFAIFSNSKAIARPHFMLIKRTCESNPHLRSIWSHIFHADPTKQRNIGWSEESGLFFKTSKFKDAGVGYFGLIDSMPTGGHYHRKIIDDLVDLNNIGTFFMMQKVLEAYKMADNLGRGNDTVEKVIGTRYRFGDLYENIEAMEVHKMSRVPAEVDDQGKPKYDGYPVYLTKETLAQKKKKQGNVYYAQMLQIPLKQGSAKFKSDWLEFYDELPTDLNYYIVADPATNPDLSDTRRRLDYTSMFLIGAGKGRKLYVIDIIRDRIGLKEKWEILKKYHKQYNIDITGYEEYGTQKDREFFLIKMEEERFYFTITPLKGSDKSKEERINMLTEFFQEGQILLPKHLHRLTKDRGVIDVVSEFVEEEYLKYPMTENDDMLDTLARIAIIDIIYPEGEYIEEVKEKYMPSPLDEGIDDYQCIWGDI